MKEKGGAIYQLFLLCLSVYVLVIIFAETFLITDPEISMVLLRIDLCICLIFLADFFVNLYYAESKRAYLKWGWIDLISSIPLMEPLRWGRLARLIRIIRFLRALKSLRVLINAIHTSKFQSLTLTVLLITFFAYTLCASLILVFERDFVGGINTANEALWWSFLNIMNAKISIAETQSAGGTVLTIVLNKVGLLLFAYFNAIIVAWLVRKRANVKNN